MGKYDQPIDEIKLLHDIIDARKLNEVKTNDNSALFNPDLCTVLDRRKHKKAKENLLAFERKVGSGVEEKLLKGLFLFLYRGSDPVFFPSDDKSDETLRGMITALSESAAAAPYLKMSRLNKWHADVIGRLMFDQIIAKAQDMLEQLAGLGSGDEEDGEESEGTGGNAVRTDTSILVDRAIRNFCKFVNTRAVDSGTSLEMAFEAAKKQGDGEKNPFNPIGFKGSSFDMSRVSNLIGRLRGMFDAKQANSIEYAPGAVTSLVFGNDLKNVVPSSLVFMDDPDLGILFDLQYLQRRLTVRKTEGISRAGKGPIIMCIDVSGSMGVVELSVAMSLAGAIGHNAASQGRDVAFIYYSDTVPDIIVLDYEAQTTLNDLESAIESVVFNRWIGDRIPHEYSAVPRMIEEGITKGVEGNGGATYYGAAFNAVSKLFELNPSWLKGDLLFLTDGGDSRIDQSAEEAMELKRLGVRMYGIALVDKRGNGFNFADESMWYFDSVAKLVLSDKPTNDEIVEQLEELF